MKTKKIGLLFVLIGLCAAAVSAQTEADFQTEANDDGSVTITKYTGWTADIKIPAKIGGKAVTAIGKTAFANCDLTGVVIPDSVTFIGERAFEGNKLAKLNTGKGVKTIESMAFSKNTQLRKVTLGADCHFVAKWEFSFFTYYSYMCNGRKAGTYTVDPEWDKNFNSRTKKEYEKVKKTAEGFTYVESPNGLAIIGYTGDSKRLTIPGKLNGKPVKYVEGLARCGLTGIRISDSVVCIGREAFSTNSLTSVTIPDNVNYIGDSAFYRNSLTSVTIPNNITYIGSHAFDDNSLTSVTIGSSVTYIGSFTFTSSSLTSITIPANVSLGDPVFYVGSSDTGFNSFYDKNGKKAGTYNTYYDDGRWNWTFKAR